MLTHYKTWIKRAYKEHFAIGAFNTNNLEMTQAIIEAADEMRSPVIIQTSEKALDYAGIDEISQIVISLAKKAKVPVILNLDHGRKIQTVQDCLKHGFTAVMYDGSHFKYRKNVNLTKKVVQIARRYKVGVEGELGALAGIEDYIKSKKVIMTKPIEAKRFIKDTGVDILAVSIGNAHGIPVPHEKFDLKRLKEIYLATKSTPLVLHGASSTAPAKIRAAIKLGVSKINIDTDLRLAFTNSLRKTLAKNKKVYDPRAVLAPSKEALKRVVKQKIKVFGSWRKA